MFEPLMISTVRAPCWSTMRHQAATLPTNEWLRQPTALSDTRTADADSLSVAPDLQSGLFSSISISQTMHLRTEAYEEPL